MEENRELSEVEPFVVQPQGVSWAAAGILLVAGCAISAFAGSLYQKATIVPVPATDQSCRMSNETLQKQSAAQIEGLKVQESLRTKVIQTCVDKGLVPVFIASNIDCKAVK